MKTLIEEIWEKTWLELKDEHHEEDGKISINRITIDHPYDVYAGLDGNRKPLVAISLNSRPRQLQTGTPAIDYLRQRRSDGRWLLIFRLNREELSQVFGKLCQDLIDTAENMPSEAALVNLVAERLGLWRKLFLGSNDGCLESYQLKGLMAELLVMEQLFEAGYPTLNVVECWQGPLGSDQDFRFQNHCIEVKAVHPSSTVVTISSVEQLDTGDLPLQLRILYLSTTEREGGHSRTIIDLVDRLEFLLAESPGCLGVFRQRLLEAGYVEHDCYRQKYFTLEKSLVLSVDNDFPKITRGMINESIENIKYSIKLDSLSKFEIHSGEIK